MHGKETTGTRPSLHESRPKAFPRTVDHHEPGGPASEPPSRLARRRPHKILLLPANKASAGIDVSGLKVVEANHLDVFLGGTYYEDDDNDESKEGRRDGRISRRKYFIVDAPSGKTRGVGGLLSDLEVTSKEKENEQWRFSRRSGGPARSHQRGEHLQQQPGRSPRALGETVFVQGEQDLVCISVNFSSPGGPSGAGGY